MGMSRNRASTQWVHRRRNHHSFPSGRRGTCRHRYHGFRPGHHCRRRQEWTLRGCSRKSLDMRYGIDFACKHAGRRWTYAVVGESARVARDIRAWPRGIDRRSLTHGSHQRQQAPYHMQWDGACLTPTLQAALRDPLGAASPTAPPPPRGQQIRRRAPYASWALPMQAVPIP
jgi:hypothetical protein